MQCFLPELHLLGLGQSLVVFGLPLIVPARLGFQDLFSSLVASLVACHFTMFATLGLDSVFFRLVAVLYAYVFLLRSDFGLPAPRLDVCRKDYSVWTVLVNFRSYALKLMYPNYDRSTESTVHGSSGFVRRGTTYMISDDLTISPTNSCSTIRILKKLNVGLDEIEEHVINISKTEAIGLLRASLMTSTALTTALGSLLLKKPKDEKF
ncbi:hypothetical protein F2Q69_00035671 [Brassica cretica]|uniref:Uncharacterized protein n=1 Tax=Brassica cretica TaxID=69181 RepID=A0A8S9SCE2_BRACR|nr:hypothetical protein F2Q69_00035671 [Brassica cretica]